MLHCDTVASRGMAQRLGSGICRHIEVKSLWQQQGINEKKSATKHVPTLSNFADIGTKGLTSDRTWKLMNLMGMNFVAGVECLAQQPMERITVTSVLETVMRTIQSVNVLTNTWERVTDRAVKGSRSSTVEGIAGQWHAKSVPMKRQRPRPSRQCKLTLPCVSTNASGRMNVVRRNQQGDHCQC